LSDGPFPTTSISALKMLPFSLVQPRGQDRKTLHPDALLSRVALAVHAVPVPSSFALEHFPFSLAPLLLFVDVLLIVWLGPSSHSPLSSSWQLTLLLPSRSPLWQCERIVSYEQEHLLIGAVVQFPSTIQIRS
jgi:hypothetical protein